MDNVKDKISKLLAMANDGRGNEFEAEAALRQAEKLIRKHGIDIAELADSTGQKPIWSWKTVSVPAGAPKPLSWMPMWFNWLSTGIAKFTDCKSQRHRDPQHGECSKFMGEETDVEYAVWLAKHLRDDVNRQANALVGSGNEKESFRKGMASRLYHRMETLRKERDAALRAAVTKTGTALIVVQNKIALRNEQFGAFKTSRSSGATVRSQSAYSMGQKAGDRASFNRPIGHQSGRALK